MFRMMTCTLKVNIKKSAVRRFCVNIRDISNNSNKKNHVRVAVYSVLSDEQLLKYKVQKKLRRAN